MIEDVSPAEHTGVFLTRECGEELLARAEPQPVDPFAPATVPRRKAG